jgi:hypothetical protein
VRNRAAGATVKREFQEWHIGLSPAMTAAAVLSAVARAAQVRRVALHHLGQRRHPCRQAETLEARTDISPSLFNTTRQPQRV